MKYFVAFWYFFVGLLVSVVVAAWSGDGGIGAATAICFFGALFFVEYKEKNEEERRHRDQQKEQNDKTDQSE